MSCAGPQPRKTGDDLGPRRKAGAVVTARGDVRQKHVQVGGARGCWLPRTQPAGQLQDAEGAAKRRRYCRNSKG